MQLDVDRGVLALIQASQGEWQCHHPESVDWRHGIGVYDRRQNPCFIWYFSVDVNVAEVERVMVSKVDSRAQPRAIGAVVGDQYSKVVKVESLEVIIGPSRALATSVRPEPEPECHRLAPPLVEWGLPHRHDIESTIIIDPDLVVSERVVPCGRLRPVVPTGDGRLEVLPAAIVNLVLQYRPISIKRVHTCPFRELESGTRRRYVVLGGLKVSVPVVQVLPCESRAIEVGEAHWFREGEGRGREPIFPCGRPRAS